MNIAILLAVAIAVIAAVGTVLWYIQPGKGP